MTDIKAWEETPVKQAVVKYKQHLKTASDYQLVIQELKDRSIKEVNNKKKGFLFTLYKALDKESKALSENKVHLMNQQVRQNYKEDSQILSQAAQSAKTEEKKHLFTMAKTLASYSKSMPMALSKKDRLRIRL